MLIVRRPPNDKFTFRLFSQLVGSVKEPASSIYLWSPIIDPAYSGYRFKNKQNQYEWQEEYETKYRTIMFEYIKHDTIILGVKDHLTSYNFNPWSETVPRMVGYLQDFLDFYKDKKVILVTSVENLGAYITNTPIVCWGGDITNQADEYPTLDPILDKNLNSNKTFVSLNRNNRWHRAMLVSLLHGIDVEHHGLISCMFKHEITDLFKESGWEFNEEQQHIKTVIDNGFVKLKNNHNLLSDDYEIYDKVNDNVSNFKNKLSEYYKNVFVEIVSETSYTEKAYLLTEKTLNSFYGCNFPIVLTSPGAVAQLREIGFDMFDDIIDHGYDAIENPIDRMYYAITRNLQLLTDAEKTKELWTLCKDRFIKNAEVAKYGMYKYYQDRALTQFSNLI